MRGIAPAAFQLRRAVGLAYASASQTSEAVRPGPRFIPKL